MKKRKKKLSLNRETLRVEKFMGRVVGGWMSQQCGPTDIGPDSECALCGTGVSGCANMCTFGAGCFSGLQCPDESQTCTCQPTAVNC